MTDAQSSAIVTGAGSGIGRAVARALVEAGYLVALAGRREQRLRESIAGLPDQRALIVVTDVTRPADISRLFERVVEQWGRVDVLFNNAGLFGAPKPVDEVTVDEWRRIVDTNLTGYFLCAQEAFRAMKSQRPQGGRIINNGSISATTPRPRSTLYTATKHAISGLTKSTSLDGRAFNIACGQIDVGNAKTEMTTQMERGMPQPDGSVRPEPTMPVDEVGRAVRYMASLPLGSNVLTMTVMANAMPFVGRG